MAKKMRMTPQPQGNDTNTAEDKARVRRGVRKRAAQRKAAEQKAKGKRMGRTD